MIRWPFTTLHELNLDWLVQKMKELEENVTGYAKNVTATAVTGAPGSDAAATVTGDLEDGVNFTFTIPRGATGATGPQGPAGADGANAILTSTSISVDSSVTIAAGHFGTIKFPLTGIVSDADHVIGVKEYNLSSVGSEASICGIRISTQNSILYVFMDLYNPTGSAVTLHGGDITISYFTN